jgi:ABC-type multidrug transport system permease subunit
MTLLLDPQQRSARPGWHVFFSHSLRYALAPFLFVSSGFFTSNFIMSGHYTWPRTSRVFVLTLTLLILGYEFVYKDRTVQSASPDRAFNAVLYSCMIPYALGVAMMLGLAKL